MKDKKEFLEINLNKIIRKKLSNYGKQINSKSIIFILKIDVVHVWKLLLFKKKKSMNCLMVVQILKKRK